MNIGIMFAFDQLSITQSDIKMISTIVTLIIDNENKFQTSRWIKSIKKQFKKMKVKLAINKKK